MPPGTQMRHTTFSRRLQAPGPKCRTCVFHGYGSLTDEAAEWSKFSGNHSQVCGPDRRSLEQEIIESISAAGYPRKWLHVDHHVAPCGYRGNSSKPSPSELWSATSTTRVSRRHGLLWEGRTDTGMHDDLQSPKS